ncbi:hypothetical protein BLA18110_00313 [Burkholderia lata]|uniref:DUF6602 domain-containing protein n=1 Tax=Burkholderia lata (strain ATCC 17760 / DSM 23089 / LMG 22485 / NCIMB 9086 / R18194 / 383) TaxID=482957 RepID=UPI0014548F75|nr:DUF6602 domain-containing protein [Burkholderia lata]VWC56079.1 hypothetical protein BLA18110_00313 [Burkholderia lata]
MDGKRIQDYWSSEVDALVKTYRQFETLIPSPDTAGAEHKGEDGRFVEDLVSEYLSRFLPKGLEVLTGFILRPAVKTGESGRERKDKSDSHSTQLDIIVFDSANYPVFQRFGKSVVVPPEGVVGVISVKKHLNDKDIKNECEALINAAALCETLNSNDLTDKARGPYLALVSVGSKIEKSRTDTLDWIFAQLSAAYSQTSNITFDKLIGFIGALDEWSIFKRRPNMPLTKAEYVGFKHRGEESHLGLQFLLTGILSVFYDETRRNLRRPGYTAFPSGRPHDKHLGSIPCDKLR